MPAYRYYTDQPLKKLAFSLKDTEHHHLSKVMRQKEGDEIELIDGLGNLAYAKIIVIKKEETLLEIKEIQHFELKYKIYLAQALPSLPHLEVLAEKGTELGMSELILFKGDKSQSYLSDSKIARLQLKLISALKQSGRLFLPKIHIIEKLEEIKPQVDFSCFGDVHTKATPLFQELRKFSELNSSIFYSGPEAGFSKRELDFFERQKIKGISLHSNILRTETAPLSFLTLMHHYLRLNTDTPIIN